MTLKKWIFNRNCMWILMWILIITVWCRIIFLSYKYLKSNKKGKMQSSLPKLEVGAIDPTTNERVTYVTEFDEEASKRQGNSLMLMIMAPLFIVGICVPCLCIIPLIMYCSMKNARQHTMQGTMNYLTEHNFVSIRESTRGVRLVIPLANIASVTKQPQASPLMPHAILVNIKPMAPPVSLHGSRVDHQGHTTPYIYQSHSVPVYNVKDAEAFAEAIRSKITAWTNQHLYEEWPFPQRKITC